MKNPFHIVLLSLCCIAGNSYAQPIAKHDTAQAVLQTRADLHVSGDVHFQEAHKNGIAGLLIDIKVKGLAPYSTHGFHIHSIGKCISPDFSSAGGHFNPDHTPHGNPDSDSAHHHLGDLPNITANAQGEAQGHFFAASLSLNPQDPDNVLHRSVVLHADPDDYVSQPSGNAGPRIACGVITEMANHKKS